MQQLLHYCAGRIPWTDVHQHDDQGAESDALKTTVLVTNSRYYNAKHSKGGNAPTRANPFLARPE